MSASADQYGVIGHPVAHSWSPFIHGLFALHGGRGLNVTLPHKLAAAELANELTPRAERARAVNTLMMLNENEILGDNTDGAGLVRDLTENNQITLGGARVLILGAGGAARGVLAPLLDLKPAKIVIANRTAERASKLARDFAELGALLGCGFESVPPGRFDLIVNATAASLEGEVPAIAAALVSERTICYDMAYGKTDTSFLRWARNNGCARTLSGWGMLVEQAAESFYVWRGVRPDTSAVLAALNAS